MWASWEQTWPNRVSLNLNPADTQPVPRCCAVAKHGLANHEAIAAAKGGVAAMALSAAATYAPKNIRINCVSPGLIDTPLAARITRSEPALKASTAMHALRRIGRPGEVATAIEFLLHPSNSFITGQNLGVDGGLGSVRAG